MKTALRIVALVLLTLLCVLLVWNVVEHVLFFVENAELLETTKKYYESGYRHGSEKYYKYIIRLVSKGMMFSPLRILFSVFAIFSCVYYAIKIIRKDTTLFVKSVITAEMLKAKITETEAKREKLLRLKKEKKIAKLQEKINKYKESK